MGSGPIFATAIATLGRVSAAVCVCFPICTFVKMLRNQINRRRRRILLLLLLLNVRRRVRSVWVRPLNNMRIDKGEFYVLYPDLRHFEPDFFSIYRMRVDQFDELLQILDPHIRRMNTNFRAAISPEQQLVIAIR